MASITQANLTIAVLVPCFNEEATVARVIADFRTVLPAAQIYVYDNASTDATHARAVEAGAIVRRERRPGKGEVVRRMFADIEADIYVMVDGDATYHAPSAPKLVAAMIETHADLVNGSRVDDSIKAYRFGHRLGNQLLTGLVSVVFGQMTSDMLSGYKILSRRYVKSFPAHSRGFEIETELMVHALELRMTIVELPTPYVERPEGSVSKLNTIRDGIRILSVIALFVREERPLAVFSGLGTFLGLVALGLGLSVTADFIETGLVTRFPTAILASAMMITAVVSVFSGLVLDTITRSRREAKRFAYLLAKDGRFSRESD